MARTGGQGKREPVSVVVLAAGQGRALADCLEGLAQQVSAPETVVTVVDTVPSDGAGDIALRHAAAHWVALTSEDGLRALCQRGTEGVRSPQMALISAAYRPDNGWLARGLKLLADGADAVIGAEAQNGDIQGITSMFLGSYVPSRIPFSQSTAVDEDLIHDLTYKYRAAGFVVIFDEQPLVTRISRPVATAKLWDVAIPDGKRPLPGLAPRSIRRPEPASAAPTELVSVVLCTAGRRPDQLDRCLKSLAGLDDANYEIVVVENSPSSSLSMEGLEAAGASHIHEPGRGLDRARNRGVGESRGGIIAFIDDDCEADPDWLKGLRQGFADPKVAFVTGRVRPASLDGTSQQWFEDRFPFDRGPYPQRFTRFDGGGRSPLSMGVVGTGANMAFRRDVLERVGGFDVALDMGTLVGGGGDLDMFARALAEGEVCQYAADAVVFHHHRDSRTQLRWQTWGYGVSEGAMCAKYALKMRGRRLHAVFQYIRLIREHRRRLTAASPRTDSYPRDLVFLELVGIVVGPVAYGMSVAQTAGSRRR